jgi:hypothetical protein
MLRYKINSLGLGTEVLASAINPDVHTLGFSTIRNIQAQES